jgi:hypothetical protein
MHDRALESAIRYGFGLTEAAVRGLQEILRREGESDITLDQAWARAIELLSLFRMMLGPSPEDPRPQGSNIGALDDEARLSN